MSKKLLFPLLMIAALSLAGCSILYPSAVSENWGSSVAQNANQQVADPEGSGPENDPGASSDGTTTSKSMKRLRTEQIKPPVTGGSKSIVEKRM